MMLRYKRASFVCSIGLVCSVVVADEIASVQQLASDVTGSTVVSLANNQEAFTIENAENALWRPVIAAPVLPDNPSVMKNAAWKVWNAWEWLTRRRAEDALDRMTIPGYCGAIPRDFAVLLVELENKEKYTEFQRKLKVRDFLEGQILHGEPGSGKTHLLISLAKHYKIPWVKVSRADFHDRFKGGSLANLKEQYNEAVKEAIKDPSHLCFLIFDEIDGIFPSRDLVKADSDEYLLTSAFLPQLEHIEENEIYQNHMKEVEKKALVQKQHFILGHQDSMGEGELNRKAQEIYDTYIFNNTPDLIKAGTTNMLHNVDGAVHRTGRFGKKLEIKRTQDAVYKFFMFQFDERNITLSREGHDYLRYSIVPRLDMYKTKMSDVRVLVEDALKNEWALSVVNNTLKTNFLMITDQSAIFQKIHYALDEKNADQNQKRWKEIIHLAKASTGVGALLTGGLGAVKLLQMTQLIKSDAPGNISPAMIAATFGLGFVGTAIGLPIAQFTLDNVHRAGYSSDAFHMAYNVAGNMPKQLAMGSR